MDTTETQGGHHKRKSSTSAIAQPHGAKRARTHDDNEEEEEEEEEGEGEDMSTILAQMADTLARLSEKQRKREEAKHGVGAPKGGRQHEGPQAQPSGATAAELSSTMADNNLNVTTSASSTSTKSGGPPQAALQPTKEQPTIRIDEDAAKLCLNPQWVRQKVQQAKTQLDSKDVQPFYDEAISCLTKDNGGPLYKEALISLRNGAELAKARVKEHQTNTYRLSVDEGQSTIRPRVMKELILNGRELSARIRDLDGILQATENALRYLEEAEKR